MTQKELNLRHRCWLELLKDYDRVIDYHSGKANVVTDALTLNAHLALNNDGSVLVEVATKYSFGFDGTLYYRGRICVLNNLDLKHDILSEVHSSTYSIHPGSMKLYCDFKQMYWWLGMKREIL
ncbi:integrase [Gossypium australe]|uniref:Integrase n=1 Tax=Gossypium australe TaxID=47621 RepID=A0A5B6WQB3_9ROSI|nr:integrase [Gossypium australe]